MARPLFFFWLVLSLCSAVQAQSLSSGPETVQHYSLPQQRLLAATATNFIEMVSHYNLDRDTAWSMACRLYGLPYLLPYHDGFGSDTGVVDRRISGLLDSALGYLHRPGSHKADLDLAHAYVQRCMALCSDGRTRDWLKECLFVLAEIHLQRGDVRACKEVLNPLILSCQRDGDRRRLARVYSALGLALPNTDPMRLVYFYRSRDLYHEMQLKENELEALWDILGCEAPDKNLMAKDLSEISALEHATGFQHTAFSSYWWCVLGLLKSDFGDALVRINRAVENVKWSGVPALMPHFYMRTGIVYMAFGKGDSALAWYRKAVDTRTQATHFYWYTGFLYLTTRLLDMGQTAECLSLIQHITHDFPPLTSWENVQVVSSIGYCYEVLQQPALADKYYMSTLRFVRENPAADPYGEMADTYWTIANFYIARSNVKKARLFLEMAYIKDSARMNFYDHMENNLLAFKIDSMTGNYRSAMQHHILYQIYRDSVLGNEQRKQLDELTLKSAAEKKDQHIQLLTQQAKVQQSDLQRNRLVKNITLAGVGCLLIFMALLYNQYRVKKMANMEVNANNAALQKIVGEKEWLLKEVHHRVKNNLQIVISLLNTQSKFLDNEEALAAISESRHRMQAMSLIHQKLYQSENMAVVNMKYYIGELAEYLDASFNTRSRIRWVLDVDAIDLDIAQAIPVGLILNEAITNSIKHAFTETGGGRIQISMKVQADGVIALSIADNGKGVPAADKGKGMGMRLIKGLIGQLGGSSQSSNKDGYLLTILFQRDMVFKDGGADE